MSDKNNSLEIYIREKFLETYSDTVKTKGSGSTGAQGDVVNCDFVVECKQKRTKENIIVDYKNEWLKTNNSLPPSDLRTVLIATENKYGEKFITLSAEDFFDLIRTYL